VVVAEEHLPGLQQVCSQLGLKLPETIEKLTS